MLLHTILQSLHAIQSFGLQLLLPQKLQPEDPLSCQVEEEEKYTKQHIINVTSVSFTSSFLYSYPVML